MVSEFRIRFLVDLLDMFGDFSALFCFFLGPAGKTTPDARGLASLCFWSCKEKRHKWAKSPPSS